jgi:hypothetical protein
VVVHLFSIIKKFEKMEKKISLPPCPSQRGYSIVFVLHMAHVAMASHLSCDAMCEVLI